MQRICNVLVGATGLCALAAVPSQVGAQDATAELIDTKGTAVGTAELNQLEQGVQILITISDLPAGEHALHIHETGECEPPFESAGDHFNPTDADHGWDSAEGPHAGDLPNIYVGEGELQVELLTATVSLEDGEASVFDDDGSAIVIHQGLDDHHSQPSGDAGDRVACGVIEQAQ